MALSLIDPFPANHCSTFFYSHSFSCALYSEILLDKCHMKSFEDINILIKNESFLFEKCLLWKKLLFEKRLFLKKKLKKSFFEKKLLFETKKFEKKIFFNAGA